ncbi:MAG: hypothetical protein WD512_05060, partial [Candidatus Paceibacterota bacterium]
MSVPIEKIKKDYDHILTDFQKSELSKLYNQKVGIIDFYVDEDDNDLYLVILDDEYQVESFHICPQEDVFFSCIGKI